MPTTHGHTPMGTKSRIYTVWHNMKARCENQNNPQYKDYGGRGIKVCERWKVFEIFFKDVGEPKTGMSIERIENDKGYEPGNVKWSTRKEQQRNRRTNIVFTVCGITGCLADLCERFNAKSNRVRTRLDRGWPIELALFHPYSKGCKNIIQQLRQSMKQKQHPNTKVIQ